MQTVEQTIERSMDLVEQLGDTTLSHHHNERSVGLVRELVDVLKAQARLMVLLEGNVLPNDADKLHSQPPEAM